MFLPLYFYNHWYRTGMLGSSGFSSPSPTRSAHSYVEVSVVGRPSLHLLFAVVTESDRCRTQGVPYPLLLA